MNNLSFAHQATHYIQEKYPHFKAQVGLVLGSGLGGFAELLENTHRISYKKLPGFPQNTVIGHEGQCIIGYLGDVGIVCLQGRSHSYEGSHPEIVKTYVRTLKLLGAHTFIATNASGSLREEAGPGELMLVTDHINFQPNNPLVGPNDEEFGPRFLALDNAYDISIRDHLLSVAKQQKIDLHQGVYLSVLGPNYETAAEIRAFKILGADAVGMSTVPEVLVAKHCGMKVGVIAVITNYATGLALTSHSHDSVVQTAQKAGSKLNTLLEQYLRRHVCP
jgi:xanthosine phosphorylase